MLTMTWLGIFTDELQENMKLLFDKSFKKGKDLQC